MNPLVKIIDDTITDLQCLNYELTDSCEMIDLPEVSKPSFYDQKLSSSDNFDKRPTKISVINSDTFEAAKGKIGNVAVLNMASDYVPGGGVLSGSKSQEEELCRRSNLLASLYWLDTKLGWKFFGYDKINDCYPWKNSTYTAVFSPNVVVYREPKTYKKINSFKVSVISMAMVRNPQEINENYKKEVKERIRMLFEVAKLNNIDTLILGAWGCGAFHNPPEIVATCFKEVLEEKEYYGFFKEVIFSILRSEVNKNYNTFKSILET